MDRVAVKLVLVLLGICNALADRNCPSSGTRSSYSTKGTLHIPYAGIKEPFEAWYDHGSASSRIDYYGGEVKTLQRSNKGKYGTSYRIVPVTTEKYKNKDTCLKRDGSRGDKIKGQSVIPDTRKMHLIGKEMIKGHSCDKCQCTTVDGDKTSEYTLWIRSKEKIPVKYEMLGRNNLLGSHYDNYSFHYEGFKFTKKLDQSVFRIPKGMKCTKWPESGKEHIHTFNPMREFIDNYDEHVDTAFDQLGKTHKKQYSDQLEEDRRKEVFRQNLRYIHSKNRENLGYQLGVNHLADRTDSEMEALRGKQDTKETSNGGLPFPYNVDEVEDIPDSIDWRSKRAVTPVKDQATCGACWSFAATGAVEGAYFLKHKKLLNFSEQALIDCSWGYHNSGCWGGDESRSYQWMKKHGLPTEKKYGKYRGQESSCHIASTTSTAHITGFVNVTPRNPKALRIAISKHGPVSIGIDASQRTFSFYSNGVYYDKDCGNRTDQLDHAVLAVGYGTMNGKGYWLVKNSWSNYWGNDGYILMSEKDNNCGVLTAPTYVILSTASIKSFSNLFLFIYMFLPFFFYS